MQHDKMQIERGENQFMNKYSTFMLSKMSSSMFLKIYTLSFMINKEDAVYGKEIIDYIKSFNTGWQPSHGTLYPILTKMTEEGLIKLSYSCEGRKYYSITPWGETYYKDRAADFRKMLSSTSKFYKTIAGELKI